MGWKSLSAKIRYNPTFVKGFASHFNNFFTCAAEGGFQISDFRECIHPKKGSRILEDLKLEKPYWQVFTNKQGFVPNLTILDLLFNEGPNSISFLELESK